MTGRLDDVEVQALIGELSEALRQLGNQTCRAMVPLWLAASRRLRERHLQDFMEPRLDFEPSEDLLGLGKSKRSKYEGLAVWRHAVLMQDTLEHIDPDFARATRAIYFTPYPPNTPPYAFSKKAAEAPEASAWPSPTTLKNQAKEGCWETVEALRRDVVNGGEGRSIDEVKRRFLDKSLRRTLKDTLKLEAHWVPFLVDDYLEER